MAFEESMIAVKTTACRAAAVAASLIAACAISACGGGGGGSSGGAGTAGAAGTGGSAGAGGNAPTGVPVLGNGEHSTAAVEVTVIATEADGLATPRDLDFHPSENELWIVNRSGPSVTIVFAYGTPEQASVVKYGIGTSHFMPEPSGIAFGAPGWLATSQEQDEVTQPNTPTDFMGPTLWTSDSGFFNADHKTHYDMMHNSPNSAGIAWDQANAYWVFDGYHSSLTRYDFGGDHGPGGEDHSDGSVGRYVEGQVGYVPDVPSHLELDHASGLLYVADTGNARVAVLDTKTGTRGANIFPNYDGGEQYQMVDATFTTLVDGAAHGLMKPSGLALRDGMVFVGDNETAKIFAFDLQGGLVDWIQTDLAPGALMGMAFDPEGKLYVADATGARVVRFAPAAQR